MLQDAFQSFGEQGSRAGAGVAHVSGESGEGTADSGIGKVLFGEVFAEQGGQIRRALFEKVGGLEGFGEGFDDQIVAGGEMLVEAARGCAGLLHQVSDSDAIESFLAKAPGRYGDNLGVCDGFVCL